MINNGKSIVKVLTSSLIDYFDIPWSLGTSRKNGTYWQADAKTYDLDWSKPRFQNTYDHPNITWFHNWIMTPICCDRFLTMLT